MTILSGRSPFAAELAELLGLQKCRRVELLVSVDEAVTVKSECYVTEAQGVEIIRLLRKYDMVERKPTVDVTELGASSRKYAVDAIGGSV